MTEFTKVGNIGSAYGIKGWVNVQSHTSPSDNIFNYQPWFIKVGDEYQEQELDAHKAHGKTFVAKLANVDDRTQAELFCPKEIWVKTEQLPSLNDEEFYWYQLQTLLVYSEFEGKRYCLGRVKEVIATGSNDVLVVEATDEIDELVESKERLIPFADEFTGSIDLDKGEMTVFWDPEF